MTYDFVSDGCRSIKDIAKSSILDEVAKVSSLLPFLHPHFFKPLELTRLCQYAKKM